MLADAALKAVVNSATHPGHLVSSPPCSADAEVPDLSDASEDDNKGENASQHPFQSPVPEEGLVSSSVTPQETAASEAPSTGPSTPIGNWLEPHDLERERWVDEAAAFSTPGAWGELDGLASPHSVHAGSLDLSMARLPSSPLGFHPAGVPMPQGLEELGMEGGSHRFEPSSSPTAGIRNVPPLLQFQAPLSSGKAAHGGSSHSGHIRLRVLTAGSCGEAAVRALLLPGRPGTRPAQPGNREVQGSGCIEGGQVAGPSTVPQPSTRRLPDPVKSSPSSHQDAGCSTDPFPHV